MSFLLGPVSGALVAGGVYYGFRTMIQTSTEQHRLDLHKLSIRLIDASTIDAPVPAAQRIERRPLLSAIQSSWNTQVQTLYQGADSISNTAAAWTRRALYGESDDPKKS